MRVGCKEFLPTHFCSLALISFYYPSSFAPSHLCEAALVKALSQFYTNGILTIQIEKIEIRQHVFEGC